MAIPVVLLDACVLYPAPLRDLLMHLTLAEVFDAKWSNAIHDEWITNLLVNRSDLNSQHLERTRHLMNANVRDALVTGYEHLIPTLTLPDPDDRHVLAAAMHSACNFILTFNLTDFPDDVLARLTLKAEHPDTFLTEQLKHHPEVFLLGVQRHRSSLRRPMKSVDEYLATLHQQGLPQLVGALRTYTEDF